MVQTIFAFLLTLVWVCLGMLASCLKQAFKNQRAWASTPTDIGEVIQPIMNLPVVMRRGNDDNGQVRTDHLDGLDELENRPQCGISMSLRMMS
jgi:hypothetical protein